MSMLGTTNKPTKATNLLKAANTAQVKAEADANSAQVKAEIDAKNAEAAIRKAADAKTAVTKTSKSKATEAAAQAYDEAMAAQAKAVESKRIAVLKTQQLDNAKSTTQAAKNNADAENKAAEATAKTSNDKATPEAITAAEAEAKTAAENAAEAEVKVADAVRKELFDASPNHSDFILHMKKELATYLAEQSSVIKLKKLHAQIQELKNDKPKLAEVISATTEAASEILNVVPTPITAVIGTAIKSLGSAAAAIINYAKKNQAINEAVKNLHKLYNAIQILQFLYNDLSTSANAQLKIDSSALTIDAKNNFFDSYAEQIRILIAEASDKLAERVAEKLCIRHYFLIKKLSTNRPSDIDKFVAFLMKAIEYRLPDVVRWKYADDAFLQAAFPGLHNCNLLGAPKDPLKVRLASKKDGGLVNLRLYFHYGPYIRNSTADGSPYIAKKDDDVFEQVYYPPYLAIPTIIFSIDTQDRSFFATVSTDTQLKQPNALKLFAIYDDINKKFSDALIAQTKNLKTDPEAEMRSFSLPKTAKLSLSNYHLSDSEPSSDEDEKGDVHTIKLRMKELALKKQQHQQRVDKYAGKLEELRMRKVLLSSTQALAKKWLVGVVPAAAADMGSAADIKSAGSAANGDIKHTSHTSATGSGGGTTSSNNKSATAAAGSTKIGKSNSTAATRSKKSTSKRAWKRHTPSATAQATVEAALEEVLKRKFTALTL